MSGLNGLKTGGFLSASIRRPTYTHISFVVELMIVTTGGFLSGATSNDADMPGPNCMPGTKGHSKPGALHKVLKDALGISL